MKPNGLDARTIFTVLVALFAMSRLPAQETTKRNELYISSGATLPFAQFAEKSFTRQAGFALAGLNLDADYLHFGRRGVAGLYANLGYANVFFDTKSYVRAYENLLGVEGALVVTAGNYNFLSGEVGFMLRFAKFRKTRIIFQTGIGYTLSAHPYLSVSHSYWGILNTVNRDLDVQISSGAAIKVDYALHEGMGIHFSYSVHSCLPDFRDVEGYWDYTYYLPVRYQNMNIGITRYF